VVGLSRSPFNDLGRCGCFQLIRSVSLLSGLGPGTFSILIIWRRPTRCDTPTIIRLRPTRCGTIYIYIYIYIYYISCELVEYVDLVYS